MSDSTIALVILAVVIGLYLWNRLPVAIVALGTALALWATNLLTLDEALAGFGDPVVIFIATLFVVSEAIDLTGLTSWAGARVVSLSGDTFGSLLGSIMALCALLAALISLNGAVAALLPMVVMIALRTSRPSSRLLMPMVYAGSAGSLLVLTGSPVNIIVSEAARDAGIQEFSFFDFAWVGLPILIATIGFSLVFSRRLLPDRAPAIAPRDLSRHAEVLAGHYALADGFYRLRVRTGSPILGLQPEEVDLADRPGVSLLGLQAGLAEPQPIRHAVEVDDVLVVSGPSDEISRMAVEWVLTVALEPLPESSPEDLLNRQMGVAEATVPPRSPIVGETVFPGMERAEELVLLSIYRQGRPQTGPTELQAGDALLVYGSWSALDTLIEDRDVLLVDSPDVVRRQVPLGPKAQVAGLILVAMVVLLAFGIVPPAVAGLLAAIALVLTKVLSSQQAYRAVSWETVVLIGGLIPLSSAIQRSGAGQRVADVVIDVVGNDRPILLLAALFVLTAVLGVVLSNTATVLIVVPIALAAAEEAGIAVRPVMMLLAVAASAALLTPVQTPGNLMVMSPAGYKFSDYARLGLPLMVIWFAAALLIIPVVWPL